MVMGMAMSQGTGEHCTLSSSLQLLALLLFVAWASSMMLTYTK